MTCLHVLYESLYIAMMQKKGIPSLNKNRGSMPESFKDFSSARIIIDCTEFKIQVSILGIDR
jgi:hypothetical protein